MTTTLAVELDIVYSYGLVGFLSTMQFFTWLFCSLGNLDNVRRYTESYVLALWQNRLYLYTAAAVAVGMWFALNLLLKKVNRDFIFISEIIYPMTILIDWHICFSMQCYIACYAVTLFSCHLTDRPVVYYRPSLYTNSPASNSNVVMYFSRRRSLDLLVPGVTKQKQKNRRKQKNIL